MAAVPEKLVVALMGAYQKLPKVDRAEKHREILLAMAERAGFKDRDAIWEALAPRLEGLAPISGQTSQNGPGTGGKGRRERKLPPAWDRQRDARLLTAPYRFVPLNRQVSRMKPEAQTPLNRPQPGNLSAVLDVTWQVETPLLIGEAQSEEGPGRKRTVIGPLKLNGEYIIPGATLRGAIRSVVEIAAFGRLFQTNRHQRFGLRDFEHDDYAAFIERGQGKPGLQAGWLTKTPDGPAIAPCSWGHVDLPDLLGTDDEDERRAWVHQDRAAKYADRDVTWTGPTAFETPQPFTRVGEDNRRELFRPDARGNRPGHLVFTGRLPGGRRGPVKKRFEYVFFDDASDPVPLDDAVWEVFETANCKPSQNRRVPVGAWAEFEDSFENGGKVPVFFVGNLPENGRDAGFSFGLTRLYRLPHRNSIGDLLNRNAGEAHRPAEPVDGQPRLHPDFVEHLFGHVYEPAELGFGHPPSTEHKTSDYSPPVETARKGRVAFGMARPVDPAAVALWPADGPITTVLGPPKPSFSPFYLVGPEKDYGADDAQLAGRKRYLPRYRPDQDEASMQPLDDLLREQVKDGLSGDVQSHLRFIAPGDKVRFRGRIRLHNVSPAELGAVLWALTFGCDAKARHLIGRAKPFGAGQVFACEVSGHLRPYGQADATFSWMHGAEPGEVSPYLEEFASDMGRYLGSADAWRKSPEISALLALAKPRGWRAAGTTYLEYQPEGGRQAELFAELRAKTGNGARRLLAAEQPPDRLLLP